MPSGARITKDEITPALRGLVNNLENNRMMLGVLSEAKAVIVSRTNAGVSLSGGKFPEYSKKRYYASIKKRPPGYPTPKGGRTTALRGGRKLKTVAYDKGYGEYKANMGFGAEAQLSVTNQMLGDIQMTVKNPKRGELFFGNRLHAAKAHKLHHSKFPFFGLTETERPNMQKAVIDYLKKIKGVK